MTSRRLRSDGRGRGLAALPPSRDGGTTPFARTCRCGRSRALRTALLASALISAAVSARAQDATWLLNPGSGDFNTAANWSPATVPTGTASFGTSNTTSLSFSPSFTAATTIGGWTLNAGASDYSFTNNRTLQFIGAGIVINGGSATITNNSFLQFFGTSMAGSATITNNADLRFFGTSMAGSATITNNSTLLFVGTSTAGSATITNNDVLQFDETSTAGTATITNNDFLGFVGTSTAGSATITNNLFLQFLGTSTADSATITNNSLLRFFNTSTGGTARFINGAGGSIDLSGLTNAGMTAGSIEGAGTISLGAKNLAVGGNNLSTTFSGVLQDGGFAGGTGGSLTKTGTGTLTLSGTNSYTGGTTINAGVLQLGNGGTTGAILGDVLNNATLAFNRSNAYQFDGAISGSGGVQQNGGGTTILTAANSYAGGTTINAGVLQLGNGGTTGAILGDVLNNATLAFNRSNAYQFDGAISGSGGVQQNGGGTTILTAANSYAGGTTINAGVLQLGNGGTTGAILGDVLNNATLAFNRSNAYQFDGAISGSGGVQQNGGGTTILTAANSYAGATTVNAGTLIVQGSILNSMTTVNAGGTLGGNGTVGNTIINGGTLSAGTSIGTLTVSGSLVMTAASTYLVEVSPTNADRTNVTGTATLGGTVQAVFAPGSYVTRSYTILSATGGLGGTKFSGLTIVPAGFTADLSYTSTDVLLNLTAALGTDGALNQNQQNVAGALNGFFNNGGALPPNFLPVFGLTGGNLANALTLLSGEAATGAQQGAFQLGSQFLGLMLDPFVDGRGGAGGGGPAIGFAPAREPMPDDVAFAYAKVMKTPVTKALAQKAPGFEQRWTAWGGAYGGYNRTSGDAAVVGSHDLTARTAGFAAGLDYHFSRDAVFGFALAGGGTDWSLAQGLGGGKSDAIQAGAYAATRAGPAYLAASLAAANHWMSTDRTAFAADHLTASFNAWSLGARVEGGYRFATALGGVTPYAAGQAQSFRTPGYSESDLNGGGFALSYDARTATAVRSELGARFDHVAAVTPEAVLTLRGRLAWAHDWTSDPTRAAVFQALPGASFIVNGAAPAKDSALVSAGSELRLANGVTLSGKLDGEFAQRSSTYAGTGTVRVSW